MTQKNMHWLFSYGTLQLERVQLQTYGRKLEGTKDRLYKYRLGTLEITDKDVLEKSAQTHHPIAQETGSPNDYIEGVCFKITEKELAQTDTYEVSDYKRIEVVLASGQKAWAYVARKMRPETSIAANIDRIQARIECACAAAGRAPEEIKLLLATKTVSVPRIKEAFEVGSTLIAENKVQEVKAKYEALKGSNYEAHFIGHLQTNKVKELLKYNITCLHALDRIRLAEKLHQRLVQTDQSLDVLIQVNTSGEASKFGVAPSQALELVRAVSAYSSLNIKGLMTIGVFSAESERVRRCFRILKALQQEIRAANIPAVDMDVLSMGMSGDLEIAIEEGATLLRVGTAVFGAREYPDSYYWNETLR